MSGEGEGWINEWGWGKRAGTQRRLPRTQVLSCARCSKRKEHVYEASEERGLGRGWRKWGGLERKERTGEREMSFRVCMYDDMICGSHAPSPSYQFCCRYALCPFVFPTGVTQYTSNYSCCTSLLALFPARSSAPTSVWSLIVFIDYSSAHYGIVHYSSACYSIVNYSSACYSIAWYSIVNYSSACYSNCMVQYCKLQ